MKINQIYLEASFISFVIHASIILYLLGFFYYESQQTSVLSKPIEVNLIFEEKIESITLVDLDPAVTKLAKTNPFVTKVNKNLIKKY